MLAPQFALLLSAIVFAAPVDISRQPILLPPAFIHDGDAIYDMHSSKLRSVIVCPDGNTAKYSQPVLLVHGADSTGLESWGSGYIPALSAHGYTPCYLDLPQRGTGDMQTYSAYVAYNIHHLAWLANGSPVIILGHGHANSIIQWALQFYPSTQRVMEAFIGLSPNLAGVDGPEHDCATLEFVDEVRCRPYVWQQKTKSSYYEALHYRYSVAQIPTTLLWSKSDEIMQPAEENARLAGAASIAVQHLCPNRTVTHAGMLSDPVTFDLVRDAVLHGGRQSLSRFHPNAFHICSPDRDPQFIDRPPLRSWLSKKQPVAENLNPTFASRVASEPPLKPYAQLRNQ